MSEQSEKQPTILLLEKDDDTRRLLIENLRDRGYRVLPAFDEEASIEWLTNNQGINIDLILMNQVRMSQQECVESLERIYQETGLSSTIPSVIVADRYQAALEGTEEKINHNKYIIYLENAQQLFDLLYRLCFDN
ncbi:MAG: hypothetical protein Tsb0014_33630 [Pleurocapsa sp.]